MADFDADMERDEALDRRNSRLKWEMSEKPACSAISEMRLLLSRASVSNVWAALQTSYAGI